MDTSEPHRLWEERDEFRRGWVYGFYSSGRVFDQTSLDSILHHGARAEDERRAFLEGYRAGQRALRSKNRWID